MSLRDHLETIYNQHGQLTPALVVEAARPEDHPLHSRVFDRAVDEAAEAWYEHRAHDLIRSVRITYRLTPDGEPRDIRAFHAIRGSDEAGYTYEPVEKIAENPFLRGILLRDAEREWKTLKSKYAHLQEFMSLVAEDVAEAA